MAPAVKITNEWRAQVGVKGSLSSFRPFCTLNVSIRGLVDERLPLLHSSVTHFEFVPVRFTVLRCFFVFFAGCVHLLCRCRDVFFMKRSKRLLLPRALRNPRVSKYYFRTAYKAWWLLLVVNNCFVNRETNDLYNRVGNT